MKKLDCILLIDDDEVANYYNKRIINKLQAAEAIIEARDGEEGLRVLLNERNIGMSDAPRPWPQLIFLDINMPGMDGFEFLESFHQNPETFASDTVIVMLTTSDDQNDIARAKSHPKVVDFITKPLQKDKLQELLNRYF